MCNSTGNSMKAGLLFVSLLICLVSVLVYYVTQYKGDLDAPSFAIHSFFRTFVNFPFPRKDLKDLQAFRFLIEAAAYPDIALHTFLTPNVIHQDQWIDVEESSIRVRVYNAQNDTKTLRNVVVWYHGGGFVVGGIVTDHAICKQLADQSHSIVVSVEYRMAPEFVFPTPVDDCHAALEWVNLNIGKFGGNREKIVVAGESAGGNLAAVVTAINLMADVEKRVPIVGTVLIYPTTDIDGDHESHAVYASTGMLSGAVTKRFAEIYCGHDDVNACSQHWLFSPLKTPNSILSQFPPTLILMAKHDVLLDEGVAFYNKLNNLDRDTQLIVYNSTIHGFFGKHFFTHGPGALKAVAEKIRNMFV